MSNFFTRLTGKHKNKEEKEAHDKQQQVQQQQSPIPVTVLNPSPLYPSLGPNNNNSNNPVPLPVQNNNNNNTNNNNNNSLYPGNLGTNNSSQVNYGLKYQANNPPLQRSIIPNQQPAVSNSPLLWGLWSKRRDIPS